MHINDHTYQDILHISDPTHTEPRIQISFMYRSYTHVILHMVIFDDGHPTHCGPTHKRTYPVSNKLLHNVYNAAHRASRRTHDHHVAGSASAWTSSSAIFSIKLSHLVCLCHVSASDPPVRYHGAIIRVDYREVQVVVVSVRHLQTHIETRY